VPSGAVPALREHFARRLHRDTHGGATGYGVWPHDAGGMGGFPGGMRPPDGMDLQLPDGMELPGGMPAPGGGQPPGGRTDAETARAHGAAASAAATS
jgi:hypothetical protein